MGTNNIATVAEDAGSFTTLLGLLDRVDLVDFVSDTDKLTVFAPTNDAFDDLGIDPNDLTDEELANILKYHVAEGVTTKFDLLLDHGDIPTVQGGTISVDLVGGWWNKELKLNEDVGIVLADVLASNGIIHAIDTVLIPPEELP